MMKSLGFQSYFFSPKRFNLGRVDCSSFNLSEEKFRKKKEIKAYVQVQKVYFFLQISNMYLANVRFITSSSNQGSTAYATVLDIEEHRLSVLCISRSLIAMLCTSNLKKLMNKLKYDNTLHTI